MRVSPDKIKICEKHLIPYTNIGNKNKRYCKQCRMEYYKSPERLKRKREHDRKYQANKKLENPDVLKQAKEKYYKTEKYRDWKILQLSIISSNIYCIRCNEKRVFNKDYCDDCDKILHVINNYDYISLCKHCNKEYGLDVKISNINKVFQLNKYCSIECNKQSNKERIIKCKNEYKKTETYKKLQSERKRNGTYRKRVIKNGNRYELITRRVLFQRFNYICQGCNIKCVHPNKNNYNEHNCATIDHIKPISKGGSHTYDNTQLLCRKCNIMKSNKENYFEHKQRAKQLELQFPLTMVKHNIGEQLALFEQGYGA